MKSGRPFCVGLFGVAGFNRGDEAIAKSLIAGLSARRPDLRFVVPVLRSGNFDHFDNVETFILDRRSPRGLWRLARKLFRCDVVMLGGGSIIQDQFNGSRTRGILGYAWTVSGLAAKLRKRIYTAPIGVDELSTDTGRQAAREILVRLDGLTVRDERSRQVALKLLDGSPGLDINVACDPAFGFGADRTPPARGKTIILSPAFEGRNEDMICEVFIEIAKAILGRDETTRIAIVAMDERQKEDAGKIERISAALDADLRTRIDLHHPSSAEEAAQILRASDGVIAMRLHAMILAYGYVPLFCISRTTKTEAMMQSFAIPGTFLGDGKSPSEIAASALETVQSSEVSAVHTERSRQAVQVLNAFYDKAIRGFEAIARS